MTRRLFVGVWLPEAARRDAADLLRVLRGREEPVRWVPAENLHVTLAFLGDVEDERLGDLRDRLSRALEGARGFAVRLGGAGTFPPRGPLRVIWLGLDEGPKEIAALASRVERTLVAGGYVAPSTRPFAAHVTLGRPKGSRGFGRLVDFLTTIRPEGSPGRIEEVTLAESRLTPRGAQYEPLARFPLAGSAGGGSNPHEGESE